ncbi:MAG: threonine/serine dehydratase [Eubacteriales bacterium]|nr:threonine/serine dehydratase [Eubacteriales bacterium]
MITAEDVLAAEIRIAPYRNEIHHTPLMRSHYIGDLFGGDVWFKCENFQKTGSFKIRGAFSRLTLLTPEERSKGAVCYSSGNHSQGVSYAAKVLGIPVRVYMPENAVPAKVAACRAYGADVTLTGSTGAEARPVALKDAEESGSPYIDPVEDPAIMSGQGTAALEILRDLPECENLFVPAGGGGLLSGISAAVKGIRPDITVIGAEPELSACVGTSFHRGEITKVPRNKTLADGLAGDAPGPMAFENVMHYVDDMVTVTEDEIRNATKILLTKTKCYVEPSAAVSLAAMLKDPRAKGKKNVCFLSGGNADENILADILKNA